ncbi:MAG: hypothetical protein EOM21_21285 [Gammaproteobacteria bacterium]|nr:hypothetical protein [Gammaproteobacteria bacterium]
MLECKKCKRTLPEDHFRIASKKCYKDRGYRNPVCKECTYGYVPLTLKRKYNTTKVCLICKEELPIDRFAITTFPYRSSYCKKCNNKKRQEKRNADGTEKTRSKRKGIQKYGISIETFNKMLEDQNRKCGICGISLKEYKEKSNRDFSVDHNHTTNKVRELLCSNCNTGLGFFKENVEILQKAINYIEKHNV